MKTVTIPVIEVADLSDELAEELKEFAWGFDNDFPEAGYSYLVNKGYLFGWLEDMETDASKGHPNELQPELEKLLGSLPSTAGQYLIVRRGDDKF